MIMCRRCARAAACSHEEELPNCPICEPLAWRIYTIGIHAGHTQALHRAAQTSPFAPVSGRCFLTLKGVLVPLHQMREYTGSRMWKKVHSSRRKAFEDEPPPAQADAGQDASGTSAAQSALGGPA